MVSHDRQYQPQAEAVDRYTALGEAFVDLRGDLQPVWERRERAYR